MEAFTNWIISLKPMYCTRLNSTNKLKRTSLCCLCCFIINKPQPNLMQETPLFKGHLPWSRGCPLNRGPLYIASHFKLIIAISISYTGLTLELNVEQEEYIGLMTPEAGIRMDISTQGEMPFPLERGISLSPGYATMIGLRKVRNWTFCPS